MILQVIATGSAGNAYLLQGEGGHSLLLDAGIPAKSIVRACGGLGAVSGCLLTHEHGDHASGCKDLLGAGIDIYATPGTWKAVNERYGITLAPRERPVEPMQPFEVGEFTVMAFPTEHDAEQPCGFLIRYNPTGETAVYATDTYYVRYTFPGVHYWLCECSYVDAILEQQVDEGEIDKALRDRLKRSHMSLKRLIDTLKANDLTEARAVVLVHLSGERSDERMMIDMVSEATGIAHVTAATKGESISLELCPF